jgi:hypothetical protein
MKVKREDRSGSNLYLLNFGGLAMSRIRERTSKTQNHSGDTFHGLGLLDPYTTQAWMFSFILKLRFVLVKGTARFGVFYVASVEFLNVAGAASSVPAERISVFFQANSISRRIARSVEDS